MATYTLTGPTTGAQQVASTNFTVTMDATAITGSVVVTPHDGGKGGTFSPASLSFTTANQALTFTYTPLNTGAVTISTTNNKSYVDPAALTYTATLNLALAINQILWAQFKNRGTRFPFYEITRDGGISEADAITLRDAFDVYYMARQARPSFTPAHEDPATLQKIYDIYGRTGRGQTPAGEDVASGVHETTQAGRSDKGKFTDDAQTGRGTDATGR